MKPGNAYRENHADGAGDLAAILADENPTSRTNYAADNNNRYKIGRKVKQFYGKAKSAFSGERAEPMTGYNSMGGALLLATAAASGSLALGGLGALCLYLAYDIATGSTCDMFGGMAKGAAAGVL